MQFHKNIVAFGINFVFNLITGGGTVGFIRKVLKADSIKAGIKKYSKKWLKAQAINYYQDYFLGIYNSNYRYGGALC